MRDVLAAVAVGLAAALIAGPASAVPGFAQTGVGAGDVARNCSVTRDKSPEQIIHYCTKAIHSTTWHSSAWPYFARAIAYVRLDQPDLDMAAKAGSGSDPNLPGIYDNRCYLRVPSRKIGK